MSARGRHDAIQRRGATPYASTMPPMSGGRKDTMIQHAESHVDHGLSETQLAYVLELFKDRNAFFVETITLPPELGEVPCGLRGPSLGDPPVPPELVRMEARGRRAYPSRVCDMPATMTRLVSVIGGPHRDEDGTEHACVLYTAHGGPLAPREVGDPSLSDEDRVASIEFWSEHALCAETRAPRADVVASVSNALGAILSRMIADSGVKGVSFTLFLLDVESNISYVSDLERRSVLVMLAEWLVFQSADLDGAMRELLLEAYLKGMSVGRVEDAGEATASFNAWRASQSFNGETLRVPTDAG